MHDVLLPAIGSVTARLRPALADDLDIRPLSWQQRLADIGPGKLVGAGISLEKGGQKIGMSLEHFPKYRQQALDNEWIVFSSSVLSEVLPCKQHALRGRLLEISQFLELAVLVNRFAHEFNPAWPLHTRKNHR